KGKCVLITGGSLGIGAAVANAFGKVGAKVAVNYNRSGVEARAVIDGIRSGGGEAILVQGDVTLPETAARVVGETVAQFGGLDVIINNAGDLIKRVNTSDYTDDYIDSLLTLNVRQVVRFMREAARQMQRQQNGGVVINVSSIGARLGGAKGSVLYAATKGFISVATRGWAKELAEHKIRVNAVSPGVIRTRFHERYSTPEVLAATQKMIPLDRIGVPDDCIGAFLYLASSTLSGYVTGQTLEV